MKDDFTTKSNSFGDIVLTGYYGEDTVVEIPEEINEINRDVFNNNDKIEKVILSPSTTIINGDTNDGAFSNCINLESVEFSKEPTSDFLLIVSNAFKGCVSLKKLIFPPIIVSVFANAFERCVSLESITFPRITKKIRSANEESINNPITICKNAFKDCRELKEVVFESDITEIEDGAFEGCTCLEEITLPHVKKMGKNVFSNCPNLKTIRTANKKGFLFLPPSGWQGSWKGDCTAEVVWEYKK